MIATVPRLAALSLCLLASGCAGLVSGARAPGDVAVAVAGPDTPRPGQRPDAGQQPVAAATPPIRPAGRSPEALDTTTAAERVAALTPRAAGRELGRTIASLGDPSEAGFWLRTPLVQAPVPGQVRPVAGGPAVRVDLRPSGGVPGSGSQLSLAAFRALGVALGDLPELIVLAD